MLCCLCSCVFLTRIEFRAHLLEHLDDLGKTHLQVRTRLSQLDEQLSLIRNSLEEEVLAHEAD